MKKILAILIVVIFTDIVSSQDLKTFISVSDNSNTGKIMNIYYDEINTSTNVPYINIGINSSVYAISFTDKDENKEIILLNKEDRYIKKNKYNEYILSDLGEELLLKSEQEYISFYDISMREAKYSIQKIMNIINTITEILKVFNSNNIIVGRSRFELLEKCKNESLIYVRQNDAEEYPQIFDKDNVIIKKYLSTYSEEINVDSDFFKLIKYGINRTIQMVIIYKENLVEIEYDTILINNVLSGNEREIVIRPSSVRYYNSYSSEK
jgi:hypothetical protein